MVRMNWFIGFTLPWHLSGRVKYHLKLGCYKVVQTEIPIKIKLL